MDQTAVNGAQIFYFEEFGIGEDQVWLRGLLNGAPYLCSAAIGCWTTKPLNYYFGRRGCIFISCIISFITVSSIAIVLFITLSKQLGDLDGRSQFLV